jgi:hypothetical protein
MTRENFGEVLSEFTPRFHSLKLLVENLREIIFPERDGTIWTGTDDAPEAVGELYDRMIAAFEKALTAEM